MTQEPISVSLPRDDYRTAVACLTELKAEMHETDFPLRVGVPRERVQQIRNQLFKAGEAAGMDMRP